MVRPPCSALCLLLSAWEGVAARVLSHIIRFLCDDGVLWRADEEIGCRFVVAHGVGAEVMATLWALAAAGHLADALHGCGDAAGGAAGCAAARWPESMRGRVAEAGGAWFLPVAGCCVAARESGWARELDGAGADLAREIRRTLGGADDYRLHRGARKDGFAKPLFSHEPLEFPALLIVPRHDEHRGDAERLYAMFSKQSRRLMYHDDRGCDQLYGAEVCRFVGRNMVHDAGTAWEAA
ncbi:hypothetical protein M885DRAFT_521401 [Pelagophyceae sp. CCMP2097]|nr:hypothetical protein M885DRAFT_521401 [Pelagophyceae sp. CCMP2097]